MSPTSTRDNRHAAGNCPRHTRGSEFTRPQDHQAEPVVLTPEQGYELWAPTYDSAPNPLLALEERVLEPLLLPIERKVILDLACGTGRWLARLLARGFRQGFGIDFSPGMLSRAQNKPKVHGRLIRADCNSIPFRSHSADLVICSFAVGHMQDLERFAQETSRIMMDGGDFYLTDIHPEAYVGGWRSGFRYNEVRAQIFAFPRSLDDLVSAFGCQELRLWDYLEPHLGQAELPIFARANKMDIFEGVSATPALLICHFRRTKAGVI